jgi:hypothetical protein
MVSFYTEYACVRACVRASEHTQKHNAAYVVLQYVRVTRSDHLHAIDLLRNVQGIYCILEFLAQC